MAEGAATLQPQPGGRAPVVALTSGCYAAAAAQAGQSLLLREPWNWLEMLVMWALYALTSAGVARLAHSGRFLSPDLREGRAVVAAALSAGELPPGARPDAWRHRLAHERRELHRARWTIAGLGSSVAALVAVAGVAGADVVVVLLAAALAGSTGVLFRRLSGRMGRAERLLARVPAG